MNCSESSGMYYHYNNYCRAAVTTLLKNSAVRELELVESWTHVGR